MKITLSTVVNIVMVFSILFFLYQIVTHQLTAEETRTHLYSIVLLLVALKLLNGEQKE